MIRFLLFFFQILQPFLKIRQTCTIPVVVATQTANNNFNSQQQKQFLQPQELHDYLKSTNEISCKSELRAMASSHNGEFYLKTYSL